MSNDEKLAISCANDSLIKMWDLRNGECIGTLHGHRGHVTSLAVNHDVDLLLSGGGQDQECRLWHMPSGVCLQKWACGININAVVMTGDENHSAVGLTDHIVVAGEDKVIQVYRKNKSELDSKLVGHEAAVNCLALSKCGSLCASGSDDHSTRLWNLGAGTCIIVLKGHAHNVRACTISSDMAWCFTGGDDHKLRLYDIRCALSGTNEHLGNCKRHMVCGSAITGIAVTDDNDKVAVTTQNGESEVWEAFTQDRLNILQGHTAKANCICITGDGNTILPCSDDKSVCLWDVSEDLTHKSLNLSNSCKKKYHGHTGAMNAVVCHIARLYLCLLVRMVIIRSNCGMLKKAHRRDNILGYLVWRRYVFLLMESKCWPDFATV